VIVLVPVATVPVCAVITKENVPEALVAVSVEIVTSRCHW
jgi:hypothetical protein